MDHIPPGSLLLTTPTSSLDIPEVNINITDNTSFESPVFQLYIALPPQGTPIGCTIATCSYNNLPYFAAYAKGSSLATSLHKHGPPNSTFWILSVQDKEFNTAEATASYIKSLQQP